MDRKLAIKGLRESTQPWQVLVVGGGATGVSLALDAATRGLRTALVERGDFGQGTSSRSTKLVHGGVRYLAQGNVRLVREALRERARLLKNAPHLVHARSFVLPCSSFGQQLFYAIGLKLYDLLAGSSPDFHRSRWLSKQACLERAPTLEPSSLRGGILYSDGQFDDSRLVINILQTAVSHGALAVNYAEVQRLTHDPAGRIQGVVLLDRESGQTIPMQAGCVINATGPWCDGLRQQDQPDQPPLVAASQGSHLVLPRWFLPGDAAVIVPKTSDGRVIFMIPWDEHVLVGTTDLAITNLDGEPTAMPEEIDFLLETAGRYLAQRPTRQDVQTVFTGIRPLVAANGKGRTSQLSRDHTILFSTSGLVTITGGKWTTARAMAEDCINQVIAQHGWPAKACGTAQLRLHGAPAAGQLALMTGRYGTDQSRIDALVAHEPRWGEPLVEGFKFRGAEVVWSVRHEMARTVEDILCRRMGLLFRQADAAVKAAPKVASLMAEQLGREPAWQTQQVADFRRLATAYQLPSTGSNPDPSSR